MIRKSGWLVALVFLASLIALVYVFSGAALRSAMVYSLEEIVGAEVNIDKVSVKLAPLALEITNLQITDASNPTHNSISFKQAKGSLEVWPALLGYYVIDELTVDGLQYANLRAKEGKVYRKNDEQSEKIDLAKLLNVDLPDADELIARANLTTPEKAEDLKRLATSQQQMLKSLKDELPNKDTLASYQSDIKALTQSKVENAADLAKKVKQLQDLKDKLNAEKAKLLSVKTKLEESKTLLSHAVTDIKAASQADLAKVQQLANLADGGLAGMSQILLGQEWANKITQLQSLYVLAKPYLPESVAAAKADEAPELEKSIAPNRILPLPSQPYPNFWVKSAKVNWLIAQGSATISINDITAQHSLIQRATTFKVDATKLPTLDTFNLSGDFAVLDKLIANVNWQLKGLNLNEFTLGSADSGLNMLKALVNSEGGIKLTNNNIAQTASFVLSDAAFSSEGNKYMQQLSSLLNKQAQIPLNISANGLVSSPEVSVKSSLDKMLGDALLGEAKQKISAYQATLNTKLANQLDTALLGQQDWAALLTAQDGEVASLSSSIENMLNAKLADAKEEAKDKLKDKLLNKLSGK